MKRNKKKPRVLIINEGSGISKRMYNYEITKPGRLDVKRKKILVKNNKKKTQ